MKSVTGLTKTEITKLRGIFKDYPYIASAYLFGSTAYGKAGPLSDVDIAILLKGSAPKGRELMHEEDYLSYRIAKALGAKEVEVVNLNRQGLVFQHNVLSTGKLIYDADSFYRVMFVTQVISHFCDFEPTLRFMNKYYFEGYRRRLTRV